MLEEVSNIIFDLDGVLIDSSAGVIESTNYALKKHGFQPRKPDEIGAYIGYPLEIMFGNFKAGPVESLKEAFQERAAEVMGPLTESLPKATETMAYLSEAGYRLGVATTKYRIHTVAIIEKFGWGKYLTSSASGDEVQRVKPAPDIVRLALKKMKASSGESVMIGDTVNDIFSARAAGIKIIMVRSPFGNDDIEKHDPDLILPNVGHLRRIF